jgi:HEAT repeat protein
MKRLHICLLAILFVNFTTSFASAKDVVKEDLAQRYGRIIEELKEFNRTHHAVGLDVTAMHQDMEKQPVQALLPLLSHPLWEVRESAVYVIRLRPQSEINHEDVRRAAVKALNLETEDDVIDDLVYLIVRSRAAGATPRLTTILLNTRHHESIRRHVAHWLGQMGNSSAAPALIKATEDKSQAVSGEALSALALLGDDRALPALRKFARSQRKPHRLSAIYGLGVMKDTTSIPYLQGLLKSSDRQLLVTSIGALGDMQAKSAIHELSPFLNHKVEEVRARALYSLLKIGGIESWRIFIARYKAKPNDHYALQGIVYLYQERVKEKLPLVQPTLTSTDLRSLADALTLTLAQSSQKPVNRMVTEDHIKTVRSLDDWYFVSTDYGEIGHCRTGHTFLVYREGNKWLMARAIEEWVW